MNKKFKRKCALLLAMVLTVGAVLPGNSVFASVTETSSPSDGNVSKDTVSESTEGTEEPVLYDAEKRNALDKAEVAVCEDIVVAAGYGFSIEKDFDGITYDKNAVNVSYYDDKGSFDGNKPGDYMTYYKVEPVSGKKSYLICRTISVREPEQAVSEANKEKEEDGGKEEPEPDPDGDKKEIVSLSEGEIEEFGEGDTMTISMSTMSLLKAASTTSTGNTMKVSFAGYAKYCGHSMGIKYISQSGKYQKHLVYCMDLNKSTTNGTVKAATASGKIKPQITFCLVNGARTLNGKCNNDKYSAGSASADYFITSGAIHVLNGEVKLSYYNNGSTVYKKIAQLVADAKAYDKSKYDASTGMTTSIKYTISPKKSNWKDIGDGLYRSTDKFVRTKSGTITNVKYTITGAPSGLTVGEIKTDAGEIKDKNDLKKYDICVAQTDASKESSNFYLYCNAKALKKIQETNAVIKIKAKAYSDEKGGRKWTPSVVSQQKITFLEEFNTTSAEATVNVATKFKEGSFALRKTDKYKNSPVAGASYYLYEDKECKDLLCKMSVTDDNGKALTGKQILTQDKYYLKEVLEPDGYVLDEKVYEIGLSKFTLYDSNGAVIQKGKELSVQEQPEKSGVIVYKKDSGTGNWVKGAGFAVFKDRECTQRVLIDGNSGEEVPVFYYNEDLDMAVSEKFEKQQDTYYVKEVVVPDGYRAQDTVYPVQPDIGGYSETNALNTPLRCDVQAVKKPKDTGATDMGDATIEGATYGLYAAENICYPDGSGTVTYQGADNITSAKGTEFRSTGATANAGALLATVKTDRDGNFSFGNLYYGNYYIKEIAPSEGCLLDETAYSVNFRESKDAHQDISLKCTVIEKVKKQPFEIEKVSYDEDAKEEGMDYVQGAEFTVKLQSDVDESGWENAAVYDTLTTNEKGHAISKELPYGTYLVRETKVPKDLYQTDDFTVEITEDSRTPQKWITLNDAPFKAYIRLVKKDIETGETIQLSGATFKIKNIKTDKYVEQKTDEGTISEFTTDETGTVTTPLKLKYGKYEAEEIKAPDGYLISEESFPFTVTKEGAVRVEENEDGEPVISVEVSNTAVKGSISIKKSGEILSGTEYDTIVDRVMSAVDGKERNQNFKYEVQSLSGAAFHVIAAENIYTPDNQTDEEENRRLCVVGGVPASKGAIVAELITDENGEASLDNLPLGKYQVVEVQAPKGFTLCKEPVDVELSYEDDHTEVVYGKADFVNERVKTKLSVIKTDGVTSYPVEGAVYGVYTKEDICDGSGEILSPADSLVSTAVTNASGTAVFANDLPLGQYYVKEMESPEGYLLDETKYDVDFGYKDQDTPVLEQEIKVKETPIIVEVSKSDITTGKELKGATLEVVRSDGEVYATWVTDGTPYQLEAIPAGEYILREKAAPYGYMIANEVTFTVEETGEIQKVAMSDERVKGKIAIYKTDSVTKAPLEGVTFELRDKDGKKLAELVTDKKGYAETELLDICTYDEEGNFKEDIPYYVVETKAAEGYITDDTPHEVVLRYEDSTKEPVVYTLELENTPEKAEKLPQTGGNYRPWIFGLAGGALIGAGVYLHRRRKKRTRV